MGQNCCGFNGDPQNNVDQTLRQERQETPKVQILLLGTGESGKTTVFRQFQLCYPKDVRDNKGITSATLANTKPLILGSLLSCAARIAKELRNPPEDAEENLTFLKNTYASDDNGFTRGYLDSGLVNGLSDKEATALVTFWNLDEVKAIWNDRQARSTLGVFDNFDYFMDQLVASPKVFGRTKWTPTKEDLLRSRQATTGIINCDFSVEGGAYRVTDVGGQRNERGKWRKAFYGVSAILYVCAVSEYDQRLFEDTTVNRLHESFEAFGNLVSYEGFANAVKVVFLNKMDLLRKKMQDRVHLNVSGLFPDAPVGFDEEQWLGWMQEKFSNSLEGLNGDTKIIFHRTTATDTERIKVVIDAIRLKILSNILADFMG